MTEPVSLRFELVLTALKLGEALETLAETQALIAYHAETQARLVETIAEEPKTLRLSADDIESLFSGWEDEKIASSSFWDALMNSLGYELLVTPSLPKANEHVVMLARSGAKYGLLLGVWGPEDYEKRLYADVYDTPQERAVLWNYFNSGLRWFDSAVEAETFLLRSEEVYQFKRLHQTPLLLLAAIQKIGQAAEAERLNSRKAKLLQDLDIYFADNREVEKIEWKQYTPYFNDGDECYFLVSSNYDDILINGKSEYELPGGWDENSYHRYRKAAYILQSYTDDEMLAFFGDHARVAVTRAGVTVEVYDHD